MEFNMLTFELPDDKGRLEIHGDKDGFLKLAKLLTELAEEKSSGHLHLMTKNWGGVTLSNEKQMSTNNLLNHVAVHLKLLE